MQAYHNDENIKAKYIERMKAHILADELIRGQGYKNGKGCAVGCTLNKYNHAAYETELGIPRWVAHLEDAIFERCNENINLQEFMSDSIKEWIRNNNLDINSYRMFPLVFLDVISPGTDLDTIKSDFISFVLEEVALKNFDHEKYPNVLAAINTVINLWKINEPANSIKWTEAQKAAAAAAYAAAAAASAAAASAAAAAAASAAAASAAAYAEAADAVYAAAAAASAAAYAANEDAEAAAYDEYAIQLLQLIRKVK